MRAVDGDTALEAGPAEGPEEERNRGMSIVGGDGTAMDALSLAEAVVNAMETSLKEAAPNIPGATPEFLELHNKAITLACGRIRLGLSELINGRAA